MVIVILKDGYAFGFEMSSFEKEKLLVERFKNGGLSPTTILDLKSKGTYKVEELQDMEFTPTRVIKKEIRSKKDKNADLKKDLDEAIKKRGERRERAAEFWESFDNLKPKKG